MSGGNAILQHVVQNDSLGVHSITAPSPLCPPALLKLSCARDANVYDFTAQIIQLPYE